METRTYNVYEYSELSERAKETARSNHAANNGYAWADEALKSIKALAEHFGGKLVRYDVDWGDSVPCSPPKFDMPEYDPEDTDAYLEIKALVDQLGDFDPNTLKGTGECVLTGFCMDEDAIDGLRKAWHDGERDLTALMEAAYDTWLKGCQDDYQHLYSDEEFADHCEANNYRFTEDGELD